MNGERRRGFVVFVLSKSSEGVESSEVFAAVSGDDAALVAARDVVAGASAAETAVSRGATAHAVDGCGGAFALNVESHRAARVSRVLGVLRLRGNWRGAVRDGNAFGIDAQNGRLAAMRLLGVVILHVLQFFVQFHAVRFQLFARVLGVHFFALQSRGSLVELAHSTLEPIALRGENGEQVRIASRRRGDVLDDFRQSSRQISLERRHHLGRLYVLALRRLLRAACDIRIGGRLIFLASRDRDLCRQFLVSIAKRLNRRGARDIRRRGVCRQVLVVVVIHTGHLLKKLHARFQLRDLFILRRRFFGRFRSRLDQLVTKLRDLRAERRRRRVSRLDRGLGRRLGGLHGCRQLRDHSLFDGESLSHIDIIFRPIHRRRALFSSPIFSRFQRLLALSQFFAQRVQFVSLRLHLRRANLSRALEIE